jgi:YesN/AraC family two-component response regulator
LKSLKMQSQLILRIFKIGLCLIMLSVLFLGTACDNCLTKQCIKNQEYNSETDNFFAELTELYNDNPDSAIIVAELTVNDYLKSGRDTDLVRIYSFLSELYQYRKNDEAKALHYITLALEVCAENPDLDFDKTFLYINTGNILYRYQMFDEAIYIYNQIPYECEEYLKPQVNTLIDNNIALSYMAKLECDSAFYYFNHSLDFIKQSGISRPLLTIQYYNYMSSLGLQCGLSDSIPKYFSKAASIFKAIDYIIANGPSEYCEIYQNNIQLDYYTNKIRSFDKMAEYMLQQEKPDSAAIMLNQALLFARKSKVSIWLTNTYQSLSKCYFDMDSTDIAINYLDSALLSVNSSGKNYQNLIGIYNSYAMLYQQNAEIEKRNYALELLNQYQDSLEIEKNSEEMLLKKIELAVVPVQLAMKNVELSKAKQQRVIDRQSYFIKLLLAGLVFIIFALLFYYRLYRNLKITQQELAKRTLESFKASRDKQSGGRAGDAAEAALALKFEEEIVNRKAFVESGISLNSVAERLESNRSYVSALINNAYEMNFNDYINKLRIEEACSRICSNINPNFTIDHLYSEVGFTGKSTFYTAFKKYTGVTPAVFFKMNSGVK